MPRFTISITNKATNETRSGTEEYADEGLADYLWTEGNFACDCNRAIFFARYGEEDEPENPPCGDDGFVATVAPAP